MLTHAIDGAQAWAAASIDVPSAWYYPLPEAFYSAAAIVKQAPVTAVEPTTDLRYTLAPVRQALSSGRGFAILEAMPDAGNLPLLYWLVGYALGRPMTQNVQGTLLYDVRDTGQDLSKGARFSVTSYESSFHTDNSFGTQLADYVGLLCLQSAKSGGRSQLLSGYALHNELLARHPDVLATLYQPFHIDRRGGVNAGDDPTIQFPIIAWNGRELLFRYLRYWIEAGHEKVGQPLTGEQVRAMNVLDECLRKPELRVEFDLKPGQMFFTNNRWLLHNRTAFEDHDEPKRRRHLLRLWLSAAA
jgi:Taurine catabolism dioxygenase TauD, TfdA family